MFIRITMQLYTSFFVYFAKPGNIMTDAHLSHTIFCLFLLSESTGTGFVTVSCFSAIFKIFVKQALENRRIHHFFPMYKVHWGRDGVVVIFLTINHNTSIRNTQCTIYCPFFNILSEVRNRFKYRQNAPFTVLVFIFFSAVPNRFKYRQTALFYCPCFLCFLCSSKSFQIV